MVWFLSRRNRHVQPALRESFKIPEVKEQPEIKEVYLHTSCERTIVIETVPWLLFWMCVPHTLMNSLEEGAELPSVIGGGPMAHHHVERWTDLSKATEQIETQAFYALPQPTPPTPPAKEDFWKASSHTCISLSAVMSAWLHGSRNHSTDWKGSIPFPC